MGILRGFKISALSSESINSFIVTFLVYLASKRKGFFLQREWVDVGDGVARCVFRQYLGGITLYLASTHFQTSYTRLESRASVVRTRVTTSGVGSS